jgi:hypothetical protein
MEYIEKAIKMNEFDSLPNEILHHIFTFTKDPVTEEFVCSRWRETISAAKLKTKIIIREYPLTVIRSRSIAKITWAINRGIPRERLCSEAAKTDQFEMLKWLWSIGMPKNELACIGAVWSGNLEMLQWLLSQGCPCSKKICLVSPGSKDITPILKWIKENTNYWVERDVMRAAVRVGNIATLQWMHYDIGMSLDSDLCRIAADHGNLYTLEWLYDRGATLSINICARAAEKNYVSIITWIHAIYKAGRITSMPWHKGISSRAILADNFELFEWLIAEGCPFDECETIVAALQQKKIDIANFLCKRYYQEDINDYLLSLCGRGIIMVAIRNGMLEAVKYIHKQGISFDISLVIWTVRWGRVNILEWMKTIGIDIHNAEIRLAAERTNQIHVIQWFDRN